MSNVKFNKGLLLKILLILFTIIVISKSCYGYNLTFEGVAKNQKIYFTSYVKTIKSTSSMQYFGGQSYFSTNDWGSNYFGTHYMVFYYGGRENVGRHLSASSDGYSSVGSKTVGYDSYSGQKITADSGFNPYKYTTKTKSINVARYGQNFSAGKPAGQAFMPTFGVGIHKRQVISMGSYNVMAELLSIDGGVVSYMYDNSDFDLKNGMVFSRGVRTSRDTHLDTIYKFFAVSNWNRYLRGDGGYKGASAMNMYNNVLKVSAPPIKREIQVNHVDQNGNLINKSGFGTQTYTIEGSAKVTVNAKLNGTTFGDIDYEYKGGRYSTASSLSSAANNIRWGNYTPFGSSSKTFGVGSKSDCMVVNLVYEKHVKKHVYVNYVDENGNKLSGLNFGYNKLRVAKNKYNRSVNVYNRPKNNCHETYEEYDLTSINLSYRYEVKEIGHNGYEFKSMEVKYGSNFNNASRAGVSNIYTTSPSNVSISSSDSRNYAVVNVVYEIIEDYTIIKDAKEFETIGTLSFINTKNTEEDDDKYATNFRNITVVPSSVGSGSNREFKSEVTPYINGAYPYVVHSLGYTKKTISGTKSQTIKAYVNGNYYRSYTYPVRYTLTYYDIHNFKMYKIKELTIYDKYTNKGGKLFEGNETVYKVGTSDSYKDRFDNGKFINGGEFDFTSTRADFTSNSQVSASSVASKVDLKFSATNDYIKIDGQTDMLLAGGISKNITSTNTTNVNVNATTSAYTNNLINYMKTSKKLTDNTDFKDLYLTIPENKENGIRELSGEVTYEIISDSYSDQFNVGDDYYITKDYMYKTSPLNDPEYPNSKYRYVRPPELVNQIKPLTSTSKVNVYNPISLDEFEVQATAGVVNHSEVELNNTILQKGADFKVIPKTKGTTQAGYNFSDTSIFVKGYAYVFDFTINYKGVKYSPGTPIYVDKSVNDGIFEGEAVKDDNTTITSQYKSKIVVLAVSNNITTDLFNYLNLDKFNINLELLKILADESTNYPIEENINSYKSDTSKQYQKDYLSRDDLYADSYHSSYRDLNASALGRIFDFAITDCSDIAYKDIFKQVEENKVNEPTGKVYNSGSRKLNYVTGDMEARSQDELKRLLPLGPYKNEDISYIKAPKMGYRISYDLKTTGYIDDGNVSNSRSIEIIPSYYYISKDGTVYDDDITLYYKTQSGNYSKFKDSGYNIYFVPNDGYRYLRNIGVTNNYSTMSNKLEPLNISSKTILTNKMMSINDDKFLQSWYGEFKLPNSTIAVSNTDSNINNPYKDGYLGVRFNIRSIDTGDNKFNLSYGSNNTAIENNSNTTQWDYEGYLSFDSLGDEVDSLSMQLERGKWQIDNETYNKIKSTVVLFDLDERADEDYE